MQNAEIPLVETTFNEKSHIGTGIEGAEPVVPIEHIKPNLLTEHVENAFN